VGTRKKATKKKAATKKKITSGPLRKQVALCFIPEFNSEGKKDVTGAFEPEAHKFASLCGPGSKVITINNRLGFNLRKKAVLKAIDAEIEEHGSGHYTTVAFFCHGWGNGIQLGFKSGSVATLADAIVRVTNNKGDVTVPLYCCSTGKDPEDDPITAVGTGDESFADKLRDALCEAGASECRVVGHTTVAHTTSNPMVLFMDGMGTDGGVGGYPPVAPKSKNWSQWKRSLRDRANNTLRLRMPFMSPSEIHEELRA